VNICQLTYCTNVAGVHVPRKTCFYHHHPYHNTQLTGDAYIDTCIFRLKVLGCVEKGLLFANHFCNVIFLRFFLFFFALLIVCVACVLYCWDQEVKGPVGSSDLHHNYCLVSKAWFCKHLLADSFSHSHSMVMACCSYSLQN